MLERSADFDFDHYSRAISDHRIVIVRKRFHSIARSWNLYGVYRSAEDHESFRDIDDSEDLCSPDLKVNGQSRVDSTGTRESLVLTEYRYAERDA